MIGLELCPTLERKLRGELPITKRDEAQIEALTRHMPEPWRWRKTTKEGVTAVVDDVVVNMAMILFMAGMGGYIGIAIYGAMMACIVLFRGGMQAIGMGVLLFVLCRLTYEENGEVCDYSECIPYDASYTFGFMVFHALGIVGVGALALMVLYFCFRFVRRFWPHRAAVDSMTGKKVVTNRSQSRGVSRDETEPEGVCVDLRRYVSRNVDWGNTGV